MNIYQNSNTFYYLLLNKFSLKLINLIMTVYNRSILLIVFSLILTNLNIYNSQASTNVCEWTGK